MNIELKAFRAAASRLREDIEFARTEAGVVAIQAIVLSSPTGSGKTVTITALMERIYEGDDFFPPDREVHLFRVSDSPELNAQSYDKILKQSSLVSCQSPSRVELPFSQERFEAGKIYFLKHRNLAKTACSPKRATGVITPSGKPFKTRQPLSPLVFMSFSMKHIVVCGENNVTANKQIHLSSASSKAILKLACNPVKLIIGMSATPERFSRLIEGTGRTKREYIDNP